MTLDLLKRQVRKIAASYRDDREARARRLFIEERPASLHHCREREFSIRSDISSFFGVPYSSVSFCGSGQLGFSIHQNSMFEPAISDLDAACIDAELFQRAWTDIARSTRGFTDLAAFGTRSPEYVTIFKEQILRRGMIRVRAMPKSHLTSQWRSFESELSARHTKLFGRITVAIYINEYAFCWKQDTSLSELI